MAGSRSDRRGRRAAPPPVIDLKAEEVGIEQPDSPSDASRVDPNEDAATAETVEAAAPPEAAPAEEKPWTPEEPPSEPRPPVEEQAAPDAWPRFVAYALGSLLLLALLGWIYYAYGDRFLAGGANERIAALASRLDQSAKAAEEQAGRLAALDSELRGMREAQAQLTEAVEQLRKRDEESTAAARRSIEAGDSRIAEVERRLAESRSATEALRSAINEAGGDGASVLAASELRTSFDALAARLAATEERLSTMAGEVEGLKQSASLAADGREKAAADAAALGQAVTALAAKLRQGVPYLQELDALAGLRPALPGLDVLRLHASEGVKTVPVLAADLSRLAPTPAVQQADRADAGFWAGLRARVAGLVKIRRLHEPDWTVVANQARDALGKGDLRAAIATVEAASPNPPQAVAAWLAEARARRDAEGALSGVEAAALAQLGGKS